MEQVNAVPEQRPPAESLKQIEVPLARDAFLSTLIRHLAGTLEEVVGLEDATGFISVVGQRVGEELDTAYKRALRLEQLDRAQVTQVLLDLKQRIQGDFEVLEQDDEKLVLGVRSCPYTEKVLGRPSICMMTSNIFGVIAAENLGYAKVSLEQTIAQGHGACRVVLYLKPSAQAEAAAGREYVRST